MIIAAAFIYEEEAPNLSAHDPAFVFKQGQLWAMLDNDPRAVALIDSGTMMSIFPARWPSLFGDAGAGLVESPFGKSKLPIRRIKSFEIGGVPFEGPVFAGKVSFPIIGADFLFSKKNVIFTRKGLKFNISYDPKDAISCARLVVGYEGNTAAQLVEDIHLLLNIDGIEQKVFFDTGRASLLEATASAPKPEKKLFPRIDFRYNSAGEWDFSPYFSRKASLFLGKDKLSLSYNHYFTNHSVEAPYVMGAGILKEYSILIDHRKGRACFFKPA